MSVEKPIYSKDFEEKQVSDIKSDLDPDLMQAAGKLAETGDTELAKVMVQQAGEQAKFDQKMAETLERQTKKSNEALAKSIATLQETLDVLNSIKAKGFDFTDESGTAQTVSQLIELRDSSKKIPEEIYQLQMEVGYYGEELDGFEHW